MGVLDHFEATVQVWDGLGFSYVSPTEAKKLVRAGTHQITTNLQASQLKTAAEFKKPKAKAKGKTRAVRAEDMKLPGVDGKQTYKTRQMKAE